jgi:hypothetical protein
MRTQQIPRHHDLACPQHGAYRVNRGLETRQQLWVGHAAEVLEKHDRHVERTFGEELIVVAR